MHGQGTNRRVRFAARRAAPPPRLLLAACCTAFLVGSAVGWGSPTVSLVMGDFGLGAAALLAAASCLRHARRRRGSRARPAWFLFGLSSAMAGLGDLVWGWYEVVLGVPVPHPSPADFCFLLFAPPAIVGLLVLAKRPVTKAGWICLGLDVWLIGGSLLTLSWSLALAHTADSEAGSVGLAALTLAYPLLDIVLVSMILALYFRFAAAARSAIHTAVGRPGADRPVRRAVHLAVASRELRLRTSAGRRLVRRFAAAGLRALERSRRGHASGRPSALRRSPTRRSAADQAGRRVAGRPHPLSGRGGVHPGDSVQLDGGAGDRSPGALRRGHRGPRPGGPAGHHAVGQHHAHPGAGPEGEPLPFPRAGVQRRHHDRRVHRGAALRLARRRGCVRHARPRS